MVLMKCCKRGKKGRVRKQSARTSDGETPCFRSTRSKSSKEASDSLDPRLPPLTLLLVSLRNLPSRGEMDRLPAELIARIARLLARDGLAQQDVLNLAKVNKRCFAAVEKVVYSQVNLSFLGSMGNERLFKLVRLRS